MRNLPIPLLFTHADFILVHKPVGIGMHGSEDALIRMLQQHYDLGQLYLCHRLDTVTSGVMLLARHAEAAAALSALFAQRSIQKYYLALTHNKPKKKQGTIIGDMQKRRSKQWLLCPSTVNPAITQFFSFGLVEGIRACVVKPLTGKTHQIRVAMKSLGSPILGDTLYGGRDCDRCYLHAFGLIFTYQGETFRFFSPPHQGEWFQHSAFSQWLAHLPPAEQLSWPRGPRE